MPGVTVEPRLVGSCGRTAPGSHNIPLGASLFEGGGGLHTGQPMRRDQRPRDPKRQNTPSTEKTEEPDRDVSRQAERDPLPARPPNAHEGRRDPRVAMQSKANSTAAAASPYRLIPKTMNSTGCTPSRGLGAIVAP